ncbi:HWE histidine kinase domain-containing protein [Phenylobacterium sp.]|uniref:sensor histidine kinase n=1 Tax=Phenylobacterium sp. TaxID=1871053 RepID=UPI00301C644A
MKPSDTPDFEAENVRLRARVAELEAMMGRPPADRSSLYRLTDRAPWGVLVTDLEGGVDYANPALKPWLRTTAPAIGTHFETVVHPPLLTQLLPALAEARAGHVKMLEADVADVSGDLRHIRVQVAPRAAGAMGITGFVVTVYDMTEWTRALEAVREKEAWFDRMNAVAPSAYHVFDFVTGRAFWVSGRIDAVYDISPEDMMALSAAEVRDLIHPDDRHRIDTHMKALSTLPDGTVAEFEIRARRRDGTYRWLLIRAIAFERGAEGRVVKALSSASDIDERRRADERQALLINELNHRVKNTLAAVQSIARQSLRRDRDPQEMSEIFTARLVSLSAAHNVLTRESWEGAGLREIIEVAMAPFDAPRIAMLGPDVRLGARAALAMSMALHELATNAAKYGALSNETGHVSLAWRARREKGQAFLELEWREAGGPAVTPPSRQGFGSRLLTQGVRADLNGVAELSFEPGGLVCRITAPLEATPPLHLS